MFLNAEINTNETEFIVHKLIMVEGYQITYERIYRMKRRVRSRKTQLISLNSVISFGNKYQGKTIEYVCDNDPSYIDWAVDKHIIVPDREVKLYLSVRRRTKDHFSGIMDSGSREIDEYSNLLPSERFYQGR